MVKITSTAGLLLLLQIFLISNGGGVNAQTCTNPIQRMEWSQLSTSQKQAYIDAFKQLQKRPNSYQTEDFRFTVSQDKVSQGYRTTQSPYPSNTQCLQRCGDPKASFVDAVTIRNIFNTATNFVAFQGDDSTNYHATGHATFGGTCDMGNPYYSPNDMLFYFHHAYVDKLLFKWQRICDEYATDYEGTIHSGDPIAINGGTSVSPNQKIDSWSSKWVAGDMLNTVGGVLCYTYSKSAGDISYTPPNCPSGTPGNTDPWSVVVNGGGGNSGNIGGTSSNGGNNFVPTTSGTATSTSSLSATITSTAGVGDPEWFQKQLRELVPIQMAAVGKVARRDYGYNVTNTDSRFSYLTGSVGPTAIGTFDDQSVTTSSGALDDHRVVTATGSDSEHVPKAYSHTRGGTVSGGYDNNRPDAYTHTKQIVSGSFLGTNTYDGPHPQPYTPTKTNSEHPSQTASTPAKWNPSMTPYSHTSKSGLPQNYTTTQTTDPTTNQTTIQIQVGNKTFMLPPNTEIYRVFRNKIIVLPKGTAASYTHNETSMNVVPMNQRPYRIIYEQKPVPVYNRPGHLKEAPKVPDGMNLTYPKMLSREQVEMWHMDWNSYLESYYRVMKSVEECNADEKCTFSYRFRPIMKVSTIISSLIAGAALVAAQCTNPVVRREWDELSKSEKQN
ncbi:hypothetical protein HDU76_006065, partial [Blyttiomyces sp. JEL0837]